MGGRRKQIKRYYRCRSGQVLEAYGERGEGGRGGGQAEDHPQFSEGGGPGQRAGQRGGQDVHDGHQGSQMDMSSRQLFI